MERVNARALFSNVLKSVISSWQTEFCIMWMSLAAAPAATVGRVALLRWTFSNCSEHFFTALNLFPVLKFFLLCWTFSVRWTFLCSADFFCFGHLLLWWKIYAALNILMLFWTFFLLHWCMFQQCFSCSLAEEFSKIERQLWKVMPYVTFVFQVSFYCNNNSQCGKLNQWIVKSCERRFETEASAVVFTRCGVAQTAAVRRRLFPVFDKPPILQ